MYARARSCLLPAIFPSGRYALLEADVLRHGIARGHELVSGKKSRQPPVPLGDWMDGQEAKDQRANEHERP